MRNPCNGRTDEQTDGQRDGRTDKQTVPKLVPWHSLDTRKWINENYGKGIRYVDTGYKVGVWQSYIGTVPEIPDVENLILCFHNHAQ